MKIQIFYNYKKTINNDSIIQSTIYLAIIQLYNYIKRYF